MDIVPGGPPEMDWHNPGRTGALTWALAYARLGYPVMPGRRFMNAPHHNLGRGWHHTPDGPGSLDQTTICTWFAETYRGTCLDDGEPRGFRGDPYANVGLQSGRGFGVIDVDAHAGQADGRVSLRTWVEEWVAEGHEWVELPYETTPSGGVHMFFRMRVDENGESELASRGWLDGVEIKAFGCFVAVWPSARSYGSTDPGDLSDFMPISYRRGPGWPCALDELPYLPPELVAAIKKTPRLRRTREGQVAELHNGEDRLPPTGKFLESGFGWFTGSRTHDMYRLSCRLWWRFDDSARDVLAVLARCYDATPCVEGFPWEKVIKQTRTAREFVRESRRDDAR